MAIADLISTHGWVVLLLGMILVSLIALDTADGRLHEDDGFDIAPAIGRGEPKRPPGDARR